jgi:hypothetical protein
MRKDSSSDFFFVRAASGTGISISRMIMVASGVSQGEHAEGYLLIDPLIHIDE